MNSVVYLCHIVFSHCSGFGYLGWSQNLVIVNRVAVNTGKQCLYDILKSFGVAGSAGRPRQTSPVADLVCIPIWGPHPHHSLLVLISEWFPWEGVEPQYGLVLRFSDGW